MCLASMDFLWGSSFEFIVTGLMDAVPWIFKAQVTYQGVRPTEFGRVTSEETGLDVDH